MIEGASMVTGAGVIQLKRLPIKPVIQPTKPPGLGAGVGVVSEHVSSCS
jgi:hypothetical protein